MNKQEFLEILDKYLDGNATTQEETLLFAYYNSFQQSEARNEDLAGPEHVMETTLLQRLQQSIQQQETTGEAIYHRTPVRRLFTRQRVAAAAAIIVLLSAGTWFFLTRTPKPEVAKTENTKPSIQDMAPGGNKAILTLADNSTIILDSAANGKLAQQGSSVVNKTKDGELTYEVSSSLPAGPEGRGEAAYNTLATPRGGQYQLVLPDGSKVWLNAASSIRYPTVFAGNERSVDITGEAYFEVSKDPKKPFRVHFVSTNREGTVEVLGTHFNINAYNDEPAIKTTLLEGMVSVTALAEPQTTNHKPQTVLKPGEQVSISQKSQLSHPIPVQTDEVMAWKNGIFSFKAADIKTVMRQLARWYDVDVVYENEIAEKFYVEISRNTNASNVFRILETTGGVHFRIGGKKIIVTK